MAIDRRVAHWQFAAAAQGGYYALTGIWPIVHIDSFLAVTGDKQEIWLVRAFGAVIVAVGVALAFTAARPELLPSGRVLGALAAVALVASDVVSWAFGAIGPVYLLDAAVNVAFLAAWGVPRHQPEPLAP